MRKDTTKGFTLLELLTVLLIIALLAALLVPVIMAARGYSQRTVCASNLRQLYSAWAMYLSDYQGSSTDWRTWPPNLRAFENYVKDRRVYICPRDPAEGFFRFARPSWEVPSSYWYLSRVSERDGLHEALFKVDTNPGILACQLHGRCLFPNYPSERGIPTCKGSLLRMRTDGSLVVRRLFLRCQYNEQGEIIGSSQTIWEMLTDKPCNIETLVICQLQWGARECPEGYPPGL